MVNGTGPATSQMNEVAVGYLIFSMHIIDVLGLDSKLALGLL